MKRETLACVVLLFAILLAVGFVDIQEVNHDIQTENKVSSN